MATFKQAAATVMLLLVLFSSCLHDVQAEFGIPRATNEGVTVDSNGNTQPLDGAVEDDYDGLIVAKLLTALPQTMSE
jgi:hypothetical protein